ncbi:hypothetical protein [Chitinophaga sp. OAE865]|uniref:hypothetical protein n=1 Tax=Chitinophaga sp. OAE865 TaxID=2817898 RepID=UPI001AE827A9
MRLQQLTGIIITVMMCVSCSQFRESIHDTLYGSDTDSSYKDLPASQDEAVTTTSSSSGASVSSNTTTTTTTIEYRNGTTIIHNSRTTKGNFLSDAIALLDAEKALRALPAFAGKSIYLYKAIHFYNDGRINVNIQHPENPEYIDEYNYSNGKWQNPKPVQLSVHDNISEALISLDNISFVCASVVYRNYNRKAENIEGAAPLTHVYGIFGANGLTWYPQSINGSRERYFISFTPAGGVKDYYRE